MASLLGKLFALTFFAGVAATIYYVVLCLRPPAPGSDQTGVIGLWLGTVVIAGSTLIAGLLARWLVPLTEVLLYHLVSWSLLAFVIGVAAFLVYGMVKAGA
jgi:hypothetical protein